jgi:hypothetical protein
MEHVQQVTTRGVRQVEALRSSEWIVREVDGGGYTVQCGEKVLHTVNAQKLRVFRSLDAVQRALKRELGVMQFKVETLKKTT